MKDGPDIARVAALIGDPARANILAALMDGRALTVSELSNAAGVTISTTSLHLKRLEQGGLVRPSKQGRHRYFALSGEDVAQVLEALMGLAQGVGAVRVRTGPRDEELRFARICYDHLAGEMGVALLNGLIDRRVLADRETLEVTADGRGFLTEFGIHLDKLTSARRKLCRNCLDWSMRRNHLAGSLGAALWDRITELGWARRCEGTRVVRFTQPGERAFRDMFGSGQSSAQASLPKRKSEWSW